MTPADLDSRTPPDGARCDGLHELGDATTIDAGAGTEGVARWLRSTVGAATGLGLLHAGTGVDLRDGATPYRLRIDPALGPEGYRTDRRPAERRGSTAAAPAGVFWGAQTLRQLLGPDAFRRAPLGPGAQLDAFPLPPSRTPPASPGAASCSTWHGTSCPRTASCATSTCWPRTSSTSSTCTSPTTRAGAIEIKRYPRLTEVGAWRERTKVGLRDSPLWDERPHGGLLHPGRHPRDRRVRRRAAHHRRPRDRHPRPLAGRHRRLPRTRQHRRRRHHRAARSGTAGASTPTCWRPPTTPCASTRTSSPNCSTSSPRRRRSSTSAATSAPRTSGARRPPRRPGSRSWGWPDEDELQSWLIRHFDRWLAERGRRLIGWDEILEGGLAPGAAVSSWRGYAGGIAAAQAGHDVVMCPEQQVYLDYRQARRRRRAGADRIRPHPGGRLPLRAGAPAAHRGGGARTSSAPRPTCGPR